MKINVITKLNANKLAWLLIAWWRLWFVQRLLSLRGNKWLVTLQEKVEDCSDTEISDGDMETAKQLHESVRLAERCHPFTIACLGKSLVLVQMLRGRGVQAQLKLGVNLDKSQGIQQLSSHAWVEIGGLAVGEPDNMKDEFTQLGRG